MCVLIKNLNRGITESVSVGRINILTTSIHHARHSQCTQLSQIWIDYSAHYSDPKQKFHLANIAFWVIGLWKMSHSYVSVNQHGFSYHQLRAASLISWNAAMWRSSLSNNERATVDRATLQWCTVTWPRVTASYPNWLALTCGVLQQYLQSKRPLCQSHKMRKPVHMPINIKGKWK